MNISNYIESGIIERYLLGLTSSEQEEELMHLRRVYPLLDLEVTAAELRIEHKLMEEGTRPPAILKEAILQRIRPDKQWQSRTHIGYNAHEPTNTHHTYLPVEPFWNRRINVSVWWRCAFIAMTVLTMSLAASTWHFYHRAATLEDILIRLKVPATNNPASSGH